MAKARAKTMQQIKQERHKRSVDSFLKQHSGLHRSDKITSQYNTPFIPQETKDEPRKREKDFQIPVWKVGEEGKRKD